MVCTLVNFELIIRLIWPPYQADMAPYQANTHRYQAVSWRRENTLILTAAKVQHRHCGSRMLAEKNYARSSWSFVKIEKTGGQNATII